MVLRTSLVASLAATAALSVGAPAAGASVAPASPFSLPTAFSGAGIGAVPAAVDFPAGVCATVSTEGQGRTGGNANQACTSAGGLSFIGPSTAISNVIGPTIITPAFVGTSIVAGGNVAIGP